MKCREVLVVRLTNAEIYPLKHCEPQPEVLGIVMISVRELLLYDD